MQISLCIVVRNEESFLGDAIASARPVIDEVVVVDTGSTDGTLAVARAAGARVIEAEWPGDLASAHDLPVAHAQGDWVLALDADEVLDPTSRHRIANLAASDTFDAYEFPVRNYQHDWRFAKWRAADPRHPMSRGSQGYVLSRPIRLFRRRAEYRYWGRVHQTIEPAVLGSGGRIGRADVPIHHYGFLRFDRDKSDLYLRLARRHAHDHPEHPRPWLELGVLLLEEGDAPAAAEAFRRARALGDRGQASFYLATALLELGGAVESISLLSEAVRLNPRDEYVAYDRADAWQSLGHAYEELGREAEAETAYRTALDLMPESPSAAVNLAGLLIDRGRLDEAERLVERLLVRHRGSSEVWSALGVLHLRRGDLLSARRALEIALEIHRPNLVALMNLGLTHARAGRPRKAARAYAAVTDQLGSEQARRLGLERRLPSGHRRRRTLIRRNYGPGLVVSVVSTLEGGGARVLVDAVLALGGRPQLVACVESALYGGQRLRDELWAAGVEVATVSSGRALQQLVADVRPSVVLHHWWKHPILNGALRVGDERWVCYGHGTFPMPFGYDAYVAVSQFQHRLQRHLPQDRLRLIPAGIDIARFDRRVPRQAGDSVTIMMVSRLDLGKFPRRLLDYLPPLDRARVLIAGYGPRRYELEPEIAERGLGDRVCFVGAVSAAELPHLLDQGNVGLHLTESGEESCPMSVLEMLAAGLPIVAEPKGGMLELVVDDANGLLASEPAEVAACLERLIESEELRRVMGEESRRTAGRYDMGRFGGLVRKLVTDVEQMPPIKLLSPRAGWSGLPTFRPRISLLLCETPRCGGNLLDDALTSTGLAGRPGEYFEDGTRRTLSGLWNLDGDLRAYIAELLERTSTPNGVFAMRIMPWQLAELEGALLGGAFPHPRYVWIRRSDTVRQAVSFEIARQTGVWSRMGEELPIKAPRPRFDRAAIADRLEEIRQGETSWQQHFAAAGVEPVNVWYEELADDYDGTARRVLVEVGIEITHGLRVGPMLLSRQSRLFERWVERFRQTSRQRSSRRTIASTVRDQT
jgi:LPS sulfotransferase NodH/glycosyltransferase involved in cell wall biosynthesis